MTPFTPRNGPDDPVIVDIVEALEELGLKRDEYRLIDYVDPEALQRLMNSGSPVRIQFTVRDIHVCVTPDGVTARRDSSEG